MFAIIYNIALVLLAVVSFPKMLYMRCKYGKYSSNFFMRLGKDFPTIQEKERYIIWIHAVSLGETKIAATLVKKIKEEITNPLFIISSVTETGHQEVLKTIPHADYKVYLPFDFSWIIEPIVQRVKPHLVILCESDYWYNFLQGAKKNKAKILVVNGKISQKSQQRLAHFPWFAQNLLSPIDFFCVQNHYYYERFLQLGIPQNKLAITGNMKFDGMTPALLPEELSKFKQQLGIQSGDQILVVGSTHDPEEKLILDILPRVWQKFPNLKILIVPRHPERFNSVADLLIERGIFYQRFTHFDSKNEVKIVLVDVMGILRQCYELATVAVVGGSFTDQVGGHNILEPSWYGVPVLYGPYMHQQQELVELMNQYQAGLQVNAQTLEIVLEDLLLNPQKIERLGQAGLKMTQELHGVTSKTWEYIKKWVPLDVRKDPFHK